jgi:hypothetical protein
MHVTEWLQNGHRSVICDFHVTSQHKDNFRATIIPSGQAFLLQTRVHPTFLNAADRAVFEFDPTHGDTSAIIASTRQTVNVIAQDVGTDFDNVWSEGSEYILPFACNPNPHFGIVWQNGCENLFAYRMGRINGYASDTLHQQIPLLRVTFTSKEEQHTSAVKADDIVIERSPTRTSRGFGSAPPPPPSAFAMRGGGAVRKGMGIKTSVKSGNFRPTKQGAGMTKKGVAAYRKANPGSKLQTAVTESNPGPARAKRRKSFCARSAGQMKMYPEAAKDPNSRIRQARRRWKC